MSFQNNLKQSTQTKKFNNREHSTTKDDKNISKKNGHKNDQIVQQVTKQNKLTKIEEKKNVIQPKVQTQQPKLSQPKSLNTINTVVQKQNTQQPQVRKNSQSPIKYQNQTNMQQSQVKNNSQNLMKEQKQTNNLTQKQNNLQQQKFQGRNNSPYLMKDSKQLYSLTLQPNNLLQQQPQVKNNSLCLTKDQKQLYSPTLQQNNQQQQQPQVRNNSLSPMKYQQQINGLPQQYQQQNNFQQQQFQVRYKSLSPTKDEKYINSQPLLQNNLNLKQPYLPNIHFLQINQNQQQIQQQSNSNTNSIVINSKLDSLVNQNDYGLKHKSHDNNHIDISQDNIEIKTILNSQKTCNENKTLTISNNNNQNLNNLICKQENIDEKQLKKNLKSFSENITINQNKPNQNINPQSKKDCIQVKAYIEDIQQKSFSENEQLVENKKKLQPENQSLNKKEDQPFIQQQQKPQVTQNKNKQQDDMVESLKPSCKNETNNKEKKESNKKDEQKLIIESQQPSSQNVTNNKEKVEFNKKDEQKLIVAESQKPITKNETNMKEKVESNKKDEKKLIQDSQKLISKNDTNNKEKVESNKKDEQKLIIKSQQPITKNETNMKEKVESNKKDEKKLIEESQKPISKNETNNKEKVEFNKKDEQKLIVAESQKPISKNDTNNKEKVESNKKDEKKLGNSNYFDMEDNNITKVGFKNLGNTCYINTALQTIRQLYECSLNKLSFLKDSQFGTNLIALFTEKKEDLKEKILKKVFEKSQEYQKHEDGGGDAYGCLINLLTEINKTIQIKQKKEEFENNFVLVFEDGMLCEKCKQYENSESFVSPFFYEHVIGIESSSIYEAIIQPVSVYKSQICEQKCKKCKNYRLLPHRRIKQAPQYIFVRIFNQQKQNIYYPANKLKQNKFSNNSQLNLIDSEIQIDNNKYQVIGFSNYLTIHYTYTAKYNNQWYNFSDSQSSFLGKDTPSCNQANYFVLQKK